MKSTSWQMAFATAGAALLSWRIGSAILAEVAYGRTHEAGISWVACAIFGTGASVPALLIWISLNNWLWPDRRNAERLAVAAAAGLFFVMPAILHWLDVRSSPGPSFMWAIITLLVYRYLFRPTAPAQVIQVP